MSSDCLLAHLKSCLQEGVPGSNDRVCWSVTRGLESNLTSWPIQGWRPPDADTAIRPLRVDGWPAPTATLFPTSQTINASPGFLYLSKGENSPNVKGQDWAGIPEPGTGQSTQRNVGLGLEKIGSCQPVVLAGRVGSNPTPGAKIVVRFKLSGLRPDEGSCSLSSGTFSTNIVVKHSETALSSLLFRS